MSMWSDVLSLSSGRPCPKKLAALDPPPSLKSCCKEVCKTVGRSCVIIRTEIKQKQDGLYASTNVMVTLLTPFAAREDLQFIDS